MDTSATGTTSATSGLPRTYSLSGGWKISLSCLGLALIAGGALGAWYFGTGHEMRTTSAAVMMVSICAAFALFGLYLLLSVWRTQVTLRGDAIELHGALLTRVLRKEDIAGWRTVRQRNAPAAFVLVPRPGAGRRMQLSQAIRFDQSFYHWLRGFADLDAKDRAASKKEILDSAELGATAEDRIRVLQNGRKTAKAFMVVTFAAAGWGWFYPQPYRAVIAVLAFMPLVALFLAFRSGGLYRLDAQRNDAHPNLAVPFIFPGFVLALRALRDFHFIGWSRAGMIALGIGVALIVAAALCDSSLSARKRVARIGALAGLLFCTTAFGFGAGLEANALFDRSRPQSFSMSVLSKHSSHSRRTVYQLVLPPWGPLPERNTVDVSARMYYSVEPGTRVCIELHDGALRLPWYLLDVCPTPAE